MEQCKRCKERGVPKSFGSPVGCAFLTPEFSPDNWQCATMNALRDLAEAGEEYLYSYRYNDSSCGVVPFDDREYGFGHFLVMTWYKNRGRTSRAYILCDDDEPKNLTLEQAELILAYHERDSLR